MSDPSKSSAAIAEQERAAMRAAGMVPVSELIEWAVENYPEQIAELVRRKRPEGETRYV